jgi:hypothetical protein
MGHWHDQATGTKLCLLDRDAVWRAIDARLRLTDLLRELTDDKWRHPSPCEKVDRAGYDRTPPEAAATAASRVWSSGWPFHARRKVAPGSGSPPRMSRGPSGTVHVHAPIDAILLVLTGRLVALPRLEGEGAAGLTAQLSPTTT